jgi:hypothetical protein
MWSTTADGTSVYPCRILNRFVCPFDKKTVVAGENNTTGEEE